MKKSNLFELIQNPIIAAIALHSFTLGYNKMAKLRNKKGNLYPRLESLFYVLPIVYHQKSLEIFKSSNELYSAINKNKTIVLGLQERANKMSKQTFDGLNLNFSKCILTYNKENRSIELLPPFNNKKLPLPLSMNDTENSVKRIQDTAFKLGSIFAKKDPKSIQFELNIVL